jgi:quinol monooxygenase YgiN
MAYLVSVDFKCKEGAAGPFGEMLRAALPDTRAYAACRNIDVYFDDSVNTYTALETWDAADDYRAYLRDRTEQGIAELVDPVLEGGWDAVIASVKWLGEKTDI